MLKTDTMKAPVTLLFKLVCVALTVGFTGVRGHEGAEVSCGTHTTPEAVESILSSQRQIFGRAIYEISNSTERALLTGRVSFPQGVKVKVRVVNCAGNTFQGFSRSIEKLNDGFGGAKIGFKLDKIVECSNGEGKLLVSSCTDAFSQNNKCPDALRSISRRVGYKDGLVIIAVNLPAYRVMGLADVGLAPSDPWIMVQASSLPDVSPNNDARMLQRSIKIENNGYTLVHEVGHAFGLLHTFENGCNFPGDYIPDTPYQSAALSRLPEYFTTLQCCVLHSTDQCGSPATCDNASGDNFDNFMDYSPDTCKKRFTPDQVAVMQATLLARRPEWVKGKKKKRSLEEVALVQRLSEMTITIQGNFSETDSNSIDLEEFAQCSENYMYKENGPIALGQPSHVAYRLDVPSSSGAIQITHCQSSSEGQPISLTYLECTENDQCTCQALSCVKDEYTVINAPTPRVLGEEDKKRYLLVSNNERLNNNITFSLDAHVILGKTEGPISPQPTSVHAGKQCDYNGEYSVYIPRGACKFHVLASPNDCKMSRVELKPKTQLTNELTTTFWNMQMNGHILSTGRAGCLSKYLAAPTSSPSMGDDTWTWRVVPVSKNVCNMVRLVVDNGPYKGQYVSVENGCALTFSKNQASSQVFGLKIQGNTV